MSYKKLIILCASLLAIVVITVGIFGAISAYFISSEDNTQGNDTSGNNSEIINDDSVKSGYYTIDGSLPIKDNYSLYENWDYYGVTVMYLTVRQGNSSDGTNHTWQDINTYSMDYYTENNLDKYKVEGLLQIGDENGPVEGQLGFGQYVPNSIVEIRGQSSSLNIQKNYKITLRDGKGTWNNQQVINLNKHMGHAVRYSNLFCYKLMSQIDSMMSSRVKFVHLYVKDETDSKTTDAFEDYGLYTYVEQINKTYLKNHNLDENGQLYKANFFEFYRYEDVIKLKTDSGYNEADFENLLEIKGNDNHSKLIEMLNELNDYSIPIETTFSKWFDEENYFTWLAFHMLVGNKDTSSRNFFLYSPSAVNKFYFISWDNDDSFNTLVRQITKWQDGLAFENGVSNYWGNVLHSRVLKSEIYREKLDDKIEELMGILNKSAINSESVKLAEIVRPYLYRLPDVEFAPINVDDYNRITKNLYDEIYTNFYEYKESLKKPMPFFLGIPVLEGNTLKFKWESSYDFNQKNIEYEFELATDYEFSDIYYSKNGLILPEAEVTALPAGQYFYRVKSKNTSGYEQYAFDYYNGDKGKYYGILCFWITDNGEIKVDEYEE